MNLTYVEVVPHPKVHPLQYATDCEAILGYMLPHDDSVNDRSEGSKLNNAHAITVKLWKDAFSHPLQSQAPCTEAIPQMESFGR